MELITVEKKALLEIMRKNREVHREIFLEAQEGYRKAIIAELDQMLSEARQGRRIRRSVDLVEPQDHTKDYDRVIRMLELETGAEVKISEQDFSAYAMDDWHWKRQFLYSNRAYSLLAAQASDRAGIKDTD